MITVTLHRDGRCAVGLPARTVSIAAGSIEAAREEAIAVLTRHAAVQARPVEVHADDDGKTMRFSVHPDGRIIVSRPGSQHRPPDPVGPSQVPAPMAPPEAYTPAASTALAAPIDNDPTPPPAPVMPSPEEQVAIATAAAVPTPVTATPKWSLPDDLDTIIMRRRTITREAVLEFTTGETVTISGAALIGRRPIADQGDDVDQLVTVNDPGRSISKTHLAARWNGGSFSIIDRGSGNGTVVHHAGTETGVRLNPGDEHTLTDGDRVNVGDHAFSVYLRTPTRE